MRSRFDNPAGKFFLAAIRLVATEAVILGPLAAFASLLDAEGPLAILFGWTGAIGFLLFATLGKDASTKGPIRTRRPIAKILSALMTAAAILGGLTGVLVVLVQVSVVPRSLAEAWLDMARDGQAFGFFSFFASEIYSLFLVAQAILFIRRKYIPFLAAFCATAFLCGGIIAENAPCLVLAALCAFAFFLVAQDAAAKAPLTRLAERLRSVAVPVAAASLFSLVFAFNPYMFASIKSPFPEPDLEALMSRIAPAFPLLRDVPGFGFTANVSQMPSSVFLSSRTLFWVRGERNSVHYLATDRYRTWNGKGWELESDGGGALPVSRMTRSDTQDPRSLRLTLAEDFTTALPIDRDTESVRITEDAPDTWTAFRNQGLRFAPGIRRGFIADLVSGDVAEKEPAEKYLLGVLGAFDVKSKPIANLAKQLRSGAKDDRDYIRILLDYLSDGYEYSLKTGIAVKKGNPVEEFLFTEKKGFCLYFASAFVLLAREGGLPARMSEGYRVVLDEYGQGIISGNNAHAWPELYLDGAWRTFEPTPPYREENPFAWTDGEDRETRRQLEALFGGHAEEEKKSTEPIFDRASRFVAQNLRAIAIASLALAFGLLAGIRLVDSGNRKLRRKARRLVRRYRRKGVAGPEESGWTGWKREVAEKENSDEAALVASRTAEAMISLAFAPAREDKSS